MSSQQSLDHFKKIREEFIKVVDSFPKEKREDVLFDEWNLKQVLIHISRWDTILADNVKLLKEGKEPPFYGGVNDFNDKSMKMGKDWIWDKAYKEFIEAGQRAISEYESLNNELWETKFWKDKSATPLKFLGIETKHYEHEHLPVIKKLI